MSTSDRAAVLSASVVQCRGGGCCCTVGWAAQQIAGVVALNKGWQHSRMWNCNEVESVGPWRTQRRTDFSLSPPMLWFCIHNEQVHELSSEPVRGEPMPL